MDGNANFDEFDKLINLCSGLLGGYSTIWSGCHGEQQKGHQFKTSYGRKSIRKSVENVLAVFLAVLWIRIRIRKDPKLFVGSGSVTRGFGSGSG
jgi:hypothetical protein